MKSFLFEIYHHVVWKMLASWGTHFLWTKIWRDRWQCSSMQVALHPKNPTQTSAIKFWCVAGRRENVTELSGRTDVWMWQWLSCWQRWQMSWPQRWSTPSTLWMLCSVYSCYLIFRKQWSWKQWPDSCHCGEGWDNYYHRRLVETKEKSC